MAKEEKEAEPAATAEPSAADLQAQGFRDSIAQVRSRSDLTAKAIAGVGGAAIAAIGIVKYADVFPFEASWLWALGLGIGFLAMAVGVALLARGFLRVQSPIVMRSDTRLIADVSRPELQEIQRAFDDTAAFNDADTLLAFEARSHRLRRVARYLPAARAQEVLAEAEAIAADVRATHARAAHAAVRRRAEAATQSRPAILALLLILAGFTLATLSSDAIDSARNAL